MVAPAARGLTPYAIARKYEERFFADSAKLNIFKPDIAPRATEHVAQMIALIQRLEPKATPTLPAKACTLTRQRTLITASWPASI